MSEDHQHYRRALDSNIVRMLLFVISFMAGVISTGAVSWMTYVRSAVTLSEVDEQIALQDKDKQTQIDLLMKAVDRNTQSITWLIENPQGPPKR